MKKILFLISALCFAATAFADPSKKMDYQHINYAKVDEYALKAPIIKGPSDMSKLVTYLTKPFKKDLPKARAIFAWIVYNIDYDDYEARFVDRTIKKGDQFEYQGDILETRSGVCRDIAQLYKKLADAAGLETQIVTGVAGQDLTSKNAENNRHAWLVIRLDDEWEYLDPTWAIQAEHAFTDTTTDRGYRKAMKQRLKDKDKFQPRSNRTVQNTYFLSDKEEFIKHHFPDNEQWQLQKRKISEKKFYRNQK